MASLAAIAVIDFEAIVIDGAMPRAVRARLAAAVADTLGRLNTQGLSPVRVFQGTIGPDARAIGGAALPLLANFGHEREALFKTAAV